MKPLPLEGIRVLDFTRAVAGPYCTMMLADLGARVIKVEEPGAGDETRRWGPPFVGGESTYFLSLNRNKESVALDLTGPRGLEAAQRLAANVDVVIENFRPGVAARLGIGYETLVRRRPDLIYASISGFGQTGPDSGKPGYDLIVQAMSGLMHMSREPGEAPVKAAFPVSDVLASLFAGQAITAALYGRERTGDGRYIEVCLLEGMLAAMSALTSSYLLTGSDPEPMGARQPNIVPYQIFQCSDAPIVVGVPNDRIWNRFCAAIGRREWTADGRFADNPARNGNREGLVSAIAAVLQSGRAADWIARFESAGVPCGPVLSIGQILEHPHVARREVVVKCAHPSLGDLKMVASPMRMADTPFPHVAPPALGQHQHVVAELQATDEKAGTA